MMVVLGLVVGFVMWRLTHPDMVDRATPMTAYAELPANAATDTAWDPRWPPLPLGGLPARRLEHIREAYAFAARRPDVMQYIPCYCGCSRFGHRSNEDCYVRRRREGVVPTWNSHGITCGICVDVTRDVAGMIAERKSADEIRRSVDAKYFAVFGRSTTTPNPPAMSLR